jgi:hypothetical protein
MKKDVSRRVLFVGISCSAGGWLFPERRHQNKHIQTTTAKTSATKPRTAKPATAKPSTVVDYFLLLPGRFFDAGSATRALRMSWLVKKAVSSMQKTIICV